MNGLLCEKNHMNYSKCQIFKQYKMEFGERVISFFSVDKHKGMTSTSHSFGNIDSKSLIYTNEAKFW